MISIIKNEKLLKLNNSWKFENIVALIFMIFGAIGWKINYAAGAIPTILFSVILMVIYNDFKYGIPAILVLLFSIGTGFVIESFPFDIVIPVAIFVIFVIIFTIRNFKKENFKYLKTCIGMMILSISFIIPIFWSHMVTSENQVFYIMYFSWLLYLIFYVLLCLIINKNAFRMLVFSLTWLAFLLTFELFASLLVLHNQYPDQNILSFTYYIGWGLCNEAGMILCVIMPFIFYELYKSNTPSLTALSLFKLFVLLIGIILTTSRGTYLFGGLELISLLIIMLIIKYDYKLLKLSTLVFAGSIGIVFIFAMTKGKFLQDISSNVFTLGFGSNGRFEMWELGFNAYKEAGHYFFGSGIVTEIREKEVFNSFQNTFIVYHNTFIEAFISGGVMGLIGIIICIFEKYKLLIKKESPFKILLLMGYIFVDLYGLIDNSYGMYYYMVPISMIIVVILKSDNLELYDKLNNNLF